MEKRGDSPRPICFKITCPFANWEIYQTEWGGYVSQWGEISPGGWGESTGVAQKDRGEGVVGTHSWIWISTHEGGLGTDWC